jgi:hypothetical protein
MPMGHICRRLAAIGAVADNTLGGSSRARTKCIAQIHIGNPIHRPRVCRDTLCTHVVTTWPQPINDLISHSGFVKVPKPSGSGSSGLPSSSQFSGSVFHFSVFFSKKINI